MELTLKPKDTRLYIRCQTPQKNLIEEAAAALGMSVSDYILSTMIERSASEIQRRNRLALSHAAFEQLHEFMQSEPQPSPELVENLSRYQKARDEGALTVAD